jgi:hypothetical protein
MGIDIDKLTDVMAAQLDVCPADWRQEILGEMITRLRKNHADVTPQHIAAVIASRNRV